MSMIRLRTGAALVPTGDGSTIVATGGRAYAVREFEMIIPAGTYLSSENGAQIIDAERIDRWVRDVERRHDAGDLPGVGGVDSNLGNLMSARRDGDNLVLKLELIGSDAIEAAERGSAMLLIGTDESGTEHIGVEISPPPDAMPVAASRTAGGDPYAQGVAEGKRWQRERLAARGIVE